MMVFNRAVLVLIVAFVFTPVIAGIVRFIEDLRFDKQVARRTARMTTGAQPLVSIVLPFAGDVDRLQRQLDLMQASLTYQRYEVLVMVSAETTAILRRLRQIVAQNTTVRVIEFTETTNVANLLSQGAMFSRGEFVLTLPINGVISGNSLEETLALFMTDINGIPAARVGAVMLETLPRRADNFATTIAQMDAAVELAADRRKQAFHDVMIRVEKEAIMYRRTALLAIGLWRSNRIGAETDLFWRLQLRGWVVRYNTFATSTRLTPPRLRGWMAERFIWTAAVIENLFAHSRDIVFQPIRYRRVVRLWLGEWIMLAWSWYMTALILWGVYLLITIHTPEIVYIVATSGAILLFVQFVVGMLQLIVAINYRQHKGLPNHFVWRVGWFAWANWWITALFKTVATGKVIYNMLFDPETRAYD
ncbi:glycosyltransferase [Weissella cibaria]|mgnify:FL=1|uniref:glycosyltransferase n=1 Tax=Weissella cibaria TaxID=137591 RepID=UPI003B501192